ncbi:GNAT family N-acetyltransferase [Paenibacillus athensensis]|nr:GNAT family N-acetyltransferase [Paenibacillus athensensis]MCD1258382.1 GNAT family N-acetyltransferase [Paenibacillus athensensis]
MSNIRPINLNLLAPCAELFAEVFNQPPWNDQWTFETATARLQVMYQTPHFYGLAYEEEGRLLGLVMGNSEVWYNGMHFKIVEFCVAGGQQRKGIGSQLLQALEAELQQRDVTQIYFITGKGGDAEAFYRKHGYTVHSGLVVMTKRLCE